QAEDGIRDRNVTGVQTCALPICPLDDLTWPQQLWPHIWPASLWGEPADRALALSLLGGGALGVWILNETKQRAAARLLGMGAVEIGRASCRERGESGGGGGALYE